MALALLCTGLTLTHPSGATKAPAGLHVSGNQIVDATGHPVVLRGINRAGTEGGPDSSTIPVSDAEIGWIGRDRAGSWHATAVRVPVGEAQWTGGCPWLFTDATSYRARLDTEIRAITRRGMVALLDLHTSTAGCTSIDRHAMPDVLALTFWSSAARHYAGNPLVAFELYNEPHFVSQDVWLRGTAAQQDCDPGLLAATLRVCRLLSPRYRAVGMQQLYDVVHAAAPGHLVVVDGRDYATTPPTARLRGPAVYAVHPYTCPGPGACQQPGNAHANTVVLGRWVALSRSAPIWVTEFGWPAQGYRLISGAAYYRQTLAWLDAQRPTWGWLAFAFDGSATGAFSLTDDTTTYAPNPTGAPVWNALRKAS
jgi:hypothetical protein